MSSVALKEKQLRHDLTAAYDAFKTKAEAVSAEVYRFADIHQGLAFIMDFLKKEGLKDEKNWHAVWAACPFLDDEDKNHISTTLPAVKFEVTTELADQAKFGITEMHCALADTGTLVANATSIDGRLASSLPEINIAIVPTEQIVPDMLTLLSNVDPKVASYLAFITGPSRTSDIERVLTIGVHGPERLIVVFVDELGGGK